MPFDLQKIRVEVANVSVWHHLETTRCYTCTKHSRLGIFIATAEVLNNKSWTFRVDIWYVVLRCMVTTILGQAVHADALPHTMTTKL